MHSDGTICPVSTVGRPGIQMSHTCVDCTHLPSGKLIVRGTIAGHLLSTSAPSIINGGSTHVGNGLIRGDCEHVEVLGHGAAK
jgi:hypothetical protein